jgi:selenocysteine lyase/cysteine desulfurase
VDPSLQLWRDETPGCANRIHLNNAGAALMPRPVVDAIVRYTQREAQIGGYECAEEAATQIEATYSSVAQLIGAQPRNLALVENATVAFFQALAAFDFQPRDVIVTTRNDYVSNQLAFLSLARRRGVEVWRAADLPGGGVDPQSVRELLREPRVRLLAVTWIPTNSGLIQPAERLGEIASEAGVPYLLDACQAVGAIPVDVCRLRCDYFTATARKFLRGPRGVGFLYVSDRLLQKDAYPLHIDMRGAAWKTADSFELVRDAKRFENWDFAYSLVLGLGEAARYALHAGVERTGGRACALAASLRLALQGLDGIRVLDRGSVLAPIVTLEKAGCDPEQAVRVLRGRGINVSASLRDCAVIDMDEKSATAVLRISPHYYNSEDEIDNLIGALREL